LVFSVTAAVVLLCIALILFSIGKKMLLKNNISYHSLTYHFTSSVVIDGLHLAPERISGTT